MEGVFEQEKTENTFYNSSFILIILHCDLRDLIEKFLSIFLI